MEDDAIPFHGLPVANEKNCIGVESELIEFQRRNGVFQSQNGCRALPAIFDSRPTQKVDSLLKCGNPITNSCNLMDDYDIASWFQHPFENSIDKEFSDFFYEMLTTDPIHADKQPVIHPHGNTAIPATKASFEGSATLMNFSDYRSAFCEEASSNETVVAMGESPLKKIIPSSGTGNSHGLSSARKMKDSLPRFSLDHLPESAYELAVASSSGCSRRSSAIHCRKRKARDVEESEGFSEEAEYELPEANKPAHRSGTGRRSRSAQVHNLSERRRRDKINEKMKALQELIPHCNKSDKASMLDEAIDYLKSLQLQLQLMWMGNGMAPISLPDIQQYMSRSVIKTSLRNATSDNLYMQNQLTLCPLQGSSSTIFDHLPDQYSSYLGFPPSQGMSICPYGPQNQMISTSADKQHADNKSSI